MWHLSSSSYCEWICPILKQEFSLIILDSLSHLQSIPAITWLLLIAQTEALPLCRRISNECPGALLMLGITSPTFPINSAYWDLSPKTFAKYYLATLSLFNKIASAVILLVARVLHQKMHQIGFISRRILITSSVAHNLIMHKI